jgi:uncharacterized protein YkwD
VDAVASCAADAAEEVCEVLRLVNEERAAESLPPLAWDASLALAAQAHAEDMVANGYFSHDSPDGRTFADRVRETDYPGAPTGENIAAGYPSPAAVVEGWMNSPGHRANILSGRSTELGVGLAERHWVQVFGVR